jgi:hypothetical protein
VPNYSTSNLVFADQNAAVSITVAPSSVFTVNWARQ